MAMALTRACCCTLARQRNPLCSSLLRNPHHQRIRFRQPLQSFKSYPAGFQSRIRAIHEAAVNMLRERNESYGTIKFVDISSDEYSPEENQGLDYKTVMGRIHAILSDGTVVTDVEAFRKLYEQVGLGWVYAVTKYEPIATIADAIYSVWAKYRLQITAFNEMALVSGRPPLEAILDTRKKKDEICNNSNACKT
ncbi:hypothetical protein SADUNF_Sadunf15G0064000 [Salix dunnii]|uniref:Uncharacterized protein n=1 Tax=Salix dunnii TaxID=1413687 RepID=A0A835JGB0_9ROSI|nr:hypothetical protein SADUNF_Sadunf15G0064000 [Salix dunnii]